MLIIEAVNRFIYSDLQSRGGVKKLSLEAFSPAEIAGILSDGAAKSTKKYKSAYRLAYLYRQGKRSPGRENAARLETALQPRLNRLKTRATLVVTGIFQVSRDRRQRTVQTVINPFDYKDLTEENAVSLFLTDYGLDDANLVSYTAKVY